MRSVAYNSMKFAYMIVLLLYLSTDSAYSLNQCDVLFVDFSPLAQGGLNLSCALVEILLATSLHMLAKIQIPGKHWPSIQQSTMIL